MAWGTLAVPDLVRSRAEFKNILDYGQDKLWSYIEGLLATYERQVQEQLNTFSRPTTERILGYGGTSGMQMVELDEYGRADVSKPAPGGNIGLPLRLYEVAVQWTRKWLQNHEPEELLAIVQDVMLVDTQNLQRQLQAALFVPTNYDFIDHLVDTYTLSVKRLANNDGFPYPPDPYGDAVPGTHNHYLARAGASLAASDIDALIKTVAEHYNTGRVRVYINAAQEAAVRALADPGQFTDVKPVEIVTGANLTTGRGNLDTSQINDRLIGYWGSQAAQIHVKPWIPAGYMLAFMADYGGAVLGRRIRPGGTGALTLEIESETEPLQARAWQREIGFGVVDRLAAAVLYTGGTVYTAPAGL